MHVYCNRDKTLPHICVCGFGVWLYICRRESSIQWPMFCPAFWLKKKICKLLLLELDRKKIFKQNSLSCQCDQIKSTLGQVKGACELEAFPNRISVCRAFPNRTGVCLGAFLGRNDMCLRTFPDRIGVCLRAFPSRTYVCLRTFPDRISVWWAD